MKFESLEERRGEERRKRRGRGRIKKIELQELKTLGFILSVFILTYDDKYTHNYLTVPTLRE